MPRPLIKNMFVEVELRGKPLPSSVVIPRSALHDQKVYVVNGNNRLEIRTVQPGFNQTNFVHIREGLKAGEKIIISQLNVVIDGMLLETTPDNQAMEALIAEAQGKGSVR